jgi:dipeptidyl aminopeptidase/acylaminoacyl peptidase
LRPKLSCGKGWLAVANPRPIFEVRDSHRGDAYPKPERNPVTLRNVRTSRPRARVIAAALALTAGQAAGQGAPSTDIHLLSLGIRDGHVSAGTPVNITARPGYDNQPSFTPDGASILFTSVREDAQSDIYRYDITTRQTTRITRTPESEYSATVMPDGRRMSVIRVEADSTQRLWSFAIDGTDPRVVLADVKPVGYHAWANDSTLALFVLGSPATLQVASARTGLARTVIGGIGRSIHRIPGGQTISFVHKVSPTEWWIRRLDAARDSTTALVRTLPRSEDYAWLPDGSALMASGNTLYRWSPPAAGATIASEWKAIATFSEPGLQQISRLAVSPRGDRVALVSAEAPPR